MATVKRKIRKKLTDRDFEKEKQKVLRELEQVTLFDDNDEAARRDRCREDFWAFAHTYLPHYFNAPKQAEFHEAIVEKVNTIVEEVIVIAAPRGFSKSTIISFAYLLWVIAYQKKFFPVLSMETQDKAEMQTWRILLELQYNPRLINDFGKLVSDEAARDDFSTLVSQERPYPTKLLAWSAGRSARGLTNAQFRPDLWINDDLESRQLARNPKRVEALEDVVLSDNLGAMCADNWTFLIIGTVICKGSMLFNCLKRKDDFVCLKFRAIENMGMPNERSTWPELHPIKKLYALLKTMTRARFLAEKQNEPIEVGGQFDERWFRYIKSLPAELDYTRLIDQIDPSYSEGGDNKAMYIMGSYQHGPERKDWLKLRDMNGKPVEEGLYTIVMRPYNRKASIDDFVNEIFKRFERWKPFRIAGDGSFAQKKMYQREIARVEPVKGYNLPVKFTSQERNKEEKIAELEPLIQRGVILFLYEESVDMENTVIQFTRHGESGIPDDGPDAIAEGIDTLRKVKKKASVTMV